MIIIDAPHFYAAVVFGDGVVSRAAPIVAYMRGWSRSKVLEYCQKKRWRVIELKGELSREVSAVVC